MPESPRFLLTTGKYDETVELLEKVAQENKSNMPPGKLTQVEKNVINYYIIHRQCESYVRLC